TGDLPGLVAAHAVGDQEEVAVVTAVVGVVLRQARLADPQRASQLGDEELVLVGRTDLAWIAQAEAPHGDGAGWCGQARGFRAGRLLGRGLAHDSFLFLS